LQCLTDQARSHCTTAPIGEFGHVLVSPDSRYVYAADGGRSALFVYRATAHGLALTECLSATPLKGRSCAVAPLLMEGGVEGLAESRDGSEIYAGGGVGDSASRVVEFGRAASGQLIAGSGPGDCVTDHSSPPAGCSEVALAGGPLSMSASGDTLYTVGGAPEYAVAALTRGPGTGALGEAPFPSGCLEFSESAVSGCALAPRWRVDTPTTVAFSSDGLLVTATEQHDNAVGVVEVARPPAGGSLVASDLRGCAAGACRRLRGTAPEQDVAVPMAVSPDGRSVYMGSGAGIAQIRVP
jgi:hypothetical protein